MSPAARRERDDVIDLELDESAVPFEPDGVLGTEHDGKLLTVYTISGGGAALVLTRETVASRSATLHEDDCTATLRTGLSYLFRDGIEKVRVRADPETITDTLADLDAPAYRYEDVLFTAELED